jgi:hypothetical protein
LLSFQTNNSFRFFFASFFIAAAQQQQLRVLTQSMLLGKANMIVYYTLIVITATILLCNSDFATALAAKYPLYKGISKALQGEDIFLYETFFYNKRGVILESGALDGIRFSTTYLFQKLMNWKCIHIEGSPENFKSLVINRPNSLNINATLCEQEQLVHYLSHNGKSVSGIREFMTENLLAWRCVSKNCFSSCLNVDIMLFC